MAKLFEKSTFLFVLLGLLVLAKGHGIAGISAAAGVKAGASAALVGAAAGSGLGAAAGGIGAAAAEGAYGAGGEGCACNDKFSEFMNKVAVLLRYYTSKELGPELQGLALRFVEFFFSHLAAEKPEAMNKLHGFLQNSVHVTGAAVAKVKA